MITTTPTSCGRRRHAGRGIAVALPLARMSDAEFARGGPGPAPPERAHRRRRARRVGQLRARPHVPAPGRSSTSPTHGTSRRAAARAAGSCASWRLVHLLHRAGRRRAGPSRAGRAPGARARRARRLAHGAHAAGVHAHIDDDGERTITVIGERHEPRGARPAAVGPARGRGRALLHRRRRRGAPVRAQRPRGRGHAADPAHAGRGGRAARRAGPKRSRRRERYAPGDIAPPPRIVVSTAGLRRGHVEREDGSTGTYPPVALPGPGVRRLRGGRLLRGRLTFGLGRGTPSRTRWRWRRAAARPSSRAAAPTRAQLTAADL